MKKTKLWLGLSSVGILFTTSFISLTNVALDNEGLINDVLKLNVEFWTLRLKDKNSRNHNISSSNPNV